jgi:glutathione S-transferase
VFRERLTSRFQFLAKSLAGKDYLFGSQFTVADGYAYYTLRSWQKLVGPEFGESYVLRAYFARVGSREAVRAALQAEGLS